jgi:hypothetical protein
VNGTAAQSGGSSFTLQNVTTNASVAVTFGANTAVSTNIAVAVVVSGKGTVGPNYPSYMTGRRYTLTAIAAKDSVFAGWSSNGVAVSSNRNYVVLANSNLVLQASFIHNPFLPSVGTFRGLFYVTNAAVEASSGSFIATVAESGAYTAYLRLAGRSYAYSGSFSLAGSDSKSIERRHENPLNLDLQLDLTNGPLTGTVSDGTWTANLLANPDGYSFHNPAPQAGHYTLILPGSEDASNQPAGNGFAAITVTSFGEVVFDGNLGDGTPVIASSFISTNGQWPLYASLYGGKGSVLGWLSLSNDGTISGQTAWFKPAETNARMYPDGFTNYVNVMGSAFQCTNGIPAPGLSGGTLILTNGGLAQSITNQLEVCTNNHLTIAGGGELNFIGRSGAFIGRVMDPETSKLILVRGAVLQNQNLGAGYFLGTNQTASLLLLPPAQTTASQP